MTWLKIDDGFATHQKIKPLSHPAFRLHVTALCRCARELTDGYLSSDDVKIVVIEARVGKRYVAELVDAQLWLPGGGGSFAIKDFLDYNPTAKSVREERLRARERMKNLRCSPERSGEHTGERSGTPSRPVKDEVKDFGEPHVKGRTHAHFKPTAHDKVTTLDYARAARDAQSEPAA